MYAMIRQPVPLLWKTCVRNADDAAEWDSKQRRVPFGVHCVREHVACNHAMPMYVQLANDAVVTAQMQATAHCLPLCTAGRGQLHTVHRLAASIRSRSNRKHVCQASSNAATPAQSTTANSSTVPYSYIIPQHAVAMFASGAVLGPFCDGLHSQHDVLHYKDPSVQLQVDVGFLPWSFETCWWVPLLFGVAGVIIGISVPLLDNIIAQQMQHQHQAQQQTQQHFKANKVASEHQQQTGSGTVLHQEQQQGTSGRVPSYRLGADC